MGVRRGSELSDQPGSRPEAHGTGVRPRRPARVVGTDAGHRAAVHVKVGQPVERGDVLLTLEAMKMELPISAPRAGVVKSVTCKAGDLVQPGVPLVELD